MARAIVDGPRTSHHLFSDCDGSQRNQGQTAYRYQNSMGHFCHHLHPHRHRDLDLRVLRVHQRIRERYRCLNRFHAVLVPLHSVEKNKFNILSQARPLSLATLLYQCAVHANPCQQPGFPAFCQQKKPYGHPEHGGGRGGQQH